MQAVDDPKAFYDTLSLLRRNLIDLKTRNEFHYVHKQ